MTTPSTNPGFWPNGARLAVSFSLMFEGGGQPISGAGGVIPDPIEKGVPDLPTNAFFAYGHYEGIPRVLDLMDKHEIKLVSFMIGKAVETSPDLAQEIVRRGHEAAAHGRVWDNSYQLPRDEEKRFIADSVETIQKVTGQNADRLERLLDAQLHLHPGDAAGSRLSLSHRRAEPRRAVHHPGARAGLRDRSLHIPHERHRLLSRSRVGIRPPTNRRCATSSISFTRRARPSPAHDGDQPARPHLWPRRQGARLDRFLAYAKGKEGVWFARKEGVASRTDERRPCFTVRARRGRFQIVGPGKPVTLGGSAPPDPASWPELPPDMGEFRWIREAPVRYHLS